MYNETERTKIEGLAFADLIPTNNLQELNIDLDALMVYPGDDIPKEHPIILQGIIPIMTEKNISVIVGLPKCRKTFFVSALAAAFFDECLGLKSADDVTGNVLIIDTEQSKEHAQRVIRRIFRLLEWDFADVSHREQIRLLCTRENTVEERLIILEKSISKYKPKFVILDGVSDIIRDTNKLDECTNAVQTLMRLSSVNECHITMVLHTNPNSEKARGHVGSELQRKAESMLLLTKSEEVTTVSPQFCRDIDFNKFSFRIDCHALPTPCDYTPTPTDSNRLLFESIFIGTYEYKYADLVKRVMGECRIKETAAYNRITKAKEAGIICVGKDKFYRLKGEPDTGEPELIEDDLPD